MEAYKLLAKLRLLTLVGYEDGELIWCGSSKQWDNLEREEEMIMRDNEIDKELGLIEIKTLPDFKPVKLI